MIPRGTIYELDPFLGYRRMEGRNISHGTHRVREFLDAIYVDFIPRGKRKPASVGATSSPSIVVLEGWDHPELGAAWDTEEVVKDGLRYVASRPRYPFSAPEWEEKFSSDLARYVAATGARIVVDYRGRVVRTVSLPEDPRILAEIAQVERSGVLPDLDFQNVVLPEEISASAAYLEGSVLSVKVNKFERSAQARRRCIEHYGSSCTVCGIEFERIYGELGAGYIEVHHVVPLSKVGCAYEADPVRDLRPVCSNCHAMLHRRDPPLAVEELQSVLLKRRLRGETS